MRVHFTAVGPCGRHDHVTAKLQRAVVFCNGMVDLNKNESMAVVQLEGTGGMMMLMGIDL